MDEDGQIIASNDSSRIGSFHEGALTVLQKMETIRIYFDESYRGAKQGVNMPFFYKSELRGVIGINGHPDEVADYAEIIRKITEVMVKEAYIGGLHTGMVGTVNSFEDARQALFFAKKERKKSFPLMNWGFNH